MISHRFMQFLAAASLLCAAIAPAAASSTGGNGFIDQVYGTRNGAVLFTLLGNTVGRSSDIPSCGAGNPTRWAIDASTIAGQAAVQVLMAAFAQHRAVFVTGTGNCSIWSDTETVEFFNIVQP